MAKVYRAKIVYDIYPDENGLLEWQDEDEQGRTEAELIEYTRDEMFELITNGVKYNDIWNMIDVEVIDE
jgi:hypothetical protein